MITVGPNELGVMLVVLFVTIVIPVWLTLFVKKKLPGKLPAGLALSFFFPLIGHLYLEGSLRYILILIVAAGVIKYAAGGLNTWLIIGAVSALVMLYRFKKLKNAETSGTTTIDIAVDDN